MTTSSQGSSSSSSPFTPERPRKFRRGSPACGRRCEPGLTSGVPSGRLPHPRTALDDRYAAARGKVVRVLAPAGYGKTSLAVEWLGNREEEVLWLSLDEEDNDQAHFLAYLVAAFQQADPEIGVRTLQMLQSPQPPQAETLVTVLINDLSATHTPLILTLDDYHFIQNPMVHEIVGFLLENQPSQFHQVVLTREDPLLPVARLLSRGQASEIRQQDLRFTLAESTRFLNRSMGLNLTPEDLDALQRRTEGWVAGLQFAGL